MYEVGVQKEMQVESIKVNVVKKMRMYRRESRV